MCFMVGFRSQLSRRWLRVEHSSGHQGQIPQRKRKVVSAVSGWIAQDAMIAIEGRRAMMIFFDYGRIAFSLHRKCD